VDLLVELPARTSLLDLVALKLALTEALGRPVDLVNAASIKPALRASILSEARTL
jgi:predicted nucleotidyltransferase